MVCLYTMELINAWPILVVWLCLFIMLHPSLCNIMRVQSLVVLTACTPEYRVQGQSLDSTLRRGANALSTISMQKQPHQL